MWTENNAQYCGTLTTTNYSMMTATLSLSMWTRSKHISERSKFQGGKKIGFGNENNFWWQWVSQDREEKHYSESNWAVWRGCVNYSILNSMTQSNLMVVDDETKWLSEEMSDIFHSVVAKLLWVIKWRSPDAKIAKLFPLHSSGTVNHW